MLAKAKLVPLQETLVQLQANHQQLQDQHEQAMAKCKEAQEIKANMAHIHGNLHKKHMVRKWTYARYSQILTTRTIQ